VTWLTARLQIRQTLRSANNPRGENQQECLHERLLFQYNGSLHATPKHAFIWHTNTIQETGIVMSCAAVIRDRWRQGRLLGEFCLGLLIRANDSE
jgi:hypothetical protein